jgi:ankyrin repeat protein
MAYLDGRPGATPESALLAAVARSDLRRIDLLIGTGADVNATSGLRLFTPLHKAAERGHCELIRTLLEAGADHTIRDSVRILIFVRCIGSLVSGI